MTKKFKQITALLLSLMLTIGMTAVVSVSAAQTDSADLGATSDEAVVGKTEYELDEDGFVIYPTDEDGNPILPTYGDFTYEIMYGSDFVADGTAMITAYSGKAKDIAVPSEVDGYTVTAIGISAFEANSAIQKVTISDTVTHIFTGAFFACENLKEVKLSNNLTYIGFSSFGSCPIKEIVLPENLTVLGDCAFADCVNLEKVTIPKNVNWWGYSTFCGCTNLKSVTISDGVTMVGESAFMGTSLTSVIIPASVETIGGQAFGYNDLSADSKVDNFKIYGYKGTAAETYANENGFTFIDLDSFNTYTDGGTGISAALAGDAELSVERLSDSAKASEVSKALGEGKELLALYDISLTKDGAAIQPDELVMVKIPCDNANAEVYRVEDDGTLTDMYAAYKDGNLEFATEHFSLYAVARDIEQTEATPDTATPDSPSANNTHNSADNTAVQTGTAAPTVLLLVVLTSALAAAYFYKRKIKESF